MTSDLVRLYGHRGDQMWTSDYRAIQFPFFVLADTRILGFETESGERTKFAEPVVTDHDGDFWIEALDE